ncbi:sulfite exporter TauE/SafE family protein [Campylobacter ureolyticus]|uniref:sulfite exporter TauE/SafE family protein n=1 Tax=Campylobacter ureolyticus TaxID=827 RepID=UPI0022B3D891|nr:sulfite exporter TauE/SafE family protein [Campylobacter ureolyticus]MCZ6155846.1 sulfite exporter TauE/SafE family protein [Campylobacter ureolyticus]
MDMFFDIFVFLVFGTVVGIISGFFGIGGGSVVVPTMIFMGYSIKTAVGVSVVQMLFSSIFGSYLNYKAGKLRINEGIFVSFGGFIGAIFSGFIVSNVSEIALEIFLSFVLLVSILKFFFSTEQAKKEIDSKPLLFLLGLFIGAFAVSTGVGGAVFLTPILVGFMGFDIKKAISMGLFFVIFSSISGFVSMSLNGLVNFKYGIMLGFGSLLGVYFGIKLSHRVNKKLQKNLLLALYLLMLLFMLKKIFVL